MAKSLVIAIDGPSGTGKSSVAYEVSKALGILYVDTGAMFRALGYAFDKHEIPFEEGERAKSFLKGLKFVYGKSKDILIEIDGEDLSEKIRTHSVSALASSVSRIPCVRSYLLEFQRALGKEKICIMEGRDIATVVFPEAFCKIFLSASLEIRAKRRYNQLLLKGQKDLNFDSVLADVKDRDYKDMNREIAPLKQAHDAIFLDTSNLTEKEVIVEISKIARQKAKESGVIL